MFAVAHLCRSAPAPSALCCDQCDPTSADRAPQHEKRRRQRNAESVTAWGSLDASTLALRPQSQVAKIDKAGNCDTAAFVITRSTPRFSGL